MAEALGYAQKEFLLENIDHNLWFDDCCPDMK